ncbi:MAG TPA: hypothetical protein VKY74_07910 [Chloroflexia bacterium]|nr:hypothetical protein [Chloroflexia bacterium]
MATTMHLPAARERASVAAARPATRETVWRLAGATIMSLAVTAFLVGTAWDIQWHSSVGRDRVLTYPHIMMLGGIAVAGLTSLALILLDTWRARRGQGVDATNSSRMFGIFQAPVGLAAAGFGALLALIAFPLDDYWHTLYGIDVTLWAPFHIMLGFSVLLIEIGVLYFLAGERNRMVEGRTRALTDIGFLANLAVALGMLMILVVQGDSKEGLGRLGSYQFVFYPILVALLLPLGLVTATRVTQRPGAATVVALVFLILRQVMFAFVPWAMDIAVNAEGLAYRPHAANFAIAPFAFPTGILAAALVVDVLAWRVRRGAPAWLVPATAAATALLVTFWDQPWASILPKYFYPGLDVTAVLLHALPFTLATTLLGTGLALLLSRGLEAVRQ